jgi:hypothetical protein
MDAASLFDAFASIEAETLSRMVIPSDALMEKFHAFVRERCEGRGDRLRIGRTWLERQCRSRLGAVIRPRFNGQVVAPMVVFPPLIFSKNGALIPNPLYPTDKLESNNVFSGFRHLKGFTDARRSE